jgi:hypothetical protein
MANESGEERVVVREVDRKTQTRLRVAELKAETAKYRAAIRKARDEAQSAERSERFASKMRLAEIRARQSASETARKNLALTSPAILVILIGGFILALATNSIPEESIATAAALLTMLSAGMLQNLRSLISESNGNGHDGSGHDEDETKPPSKPQPRSH